MDSKNPLEAMGKVPKFKKDFEYEFSESHF
jgi:hypothetical protein